MPPPLSKDKSLWLSYPLRVKRSPGAFGSCHFPELGGWEWGVRHLTWKLGTRAQARGSLTLPSVLCPQQEPDGDEASVPSGAKPALY